MEIWKMSKSIRQQKMADTVITTQGYSYKMFILSSLELKI